MYILLPYFASTINKLNIYCNVHNDSFNTIFGSEALASPGILREITTLLKFFGGTEVPLLMKLRNIS